MVLLCSVGASECALMQLSNVVQWTRGYNVFMKLNQRLPVLKEERNSALWRDDNSGIGTMFTSASKK